MVRKISLREVNQFLFCGVLICAVLYFAKQVLIPLTFAIFFAMLFTPLCRRMERIGVNRAVAGLVSVLLLLVAVAGIGFLVALQSKQLARQLPTIESRAQQFMKKTQAFVYEKFNVPVQKQDEMLNKRLKDMVASSGKAVKGVLSGIMGIATMSVMVMIFTFLFLINRDKYEAFFVQMAGGETMPDQARKLIGNIGTVAQGYLKGRVISILIFMALFTVGFLIAGLKSAFLLAFVASVLTIVPYIGPIIGGILPILFALVTGDSGNVALGVIIVVAVVNAIDNYWIEPHVVGGQVSVSAFFSILILLIGGVLWGVAGMVLFLPMLGVAKIIFDSIPELKPYGYLIGDQRDKNSQGKIMKKLRSIFKKDVS